MSVSKKTIIAAAGVGGADYIGSAYHVITNSRSNLLDVRLDAETGYVAFMGRDVSLNIHHLDLIDQDGDYLWSKKFSVGNNTSAQQPIAFYGDDVYFCMRFNNSAWENGKINKDTGTLTQLGQWTFNDYGANKYSRALILNDYIYVSGWESDDLQTISWSDISHTSRNGFISQVSGVNNLGASLEVAKDIQYTVTGEDSAYLSIGQTTSSVGNKGVVGQYTITGNTTIARTFMKSISGDSSGHSTDVVQNAKSDSSGNLYIGGYARYGGATNAHAYYFMKFNSSGTLQWIREFAGTLQPNNTYSRCSSYICSQGNIHFSFVEYTADNNHARTIYTCDDSGNLISKTTIKFPAAGGVLAGRNMCDMAGDGFVFAVEAGGSPYEVNVVRIPLNTDISYSSSELEIVYDDTVTWNVGSASDYSILDPSGNTYLFSVYDPNQTNIASASSNTVSDRTSPAWASPIDIPY